MRTECHRTAARRDRPGGFCPEIKQAADGVSVTGKRSKQGRVEGHSGDQRGWLSAQLRLLLSKKGTLDEPLNLFLPHSPEMRICPVSDAIPSLQRAGGVNEAMGLEGHAWDQGT